MQQIGKDAAKANETAAKSSNQFNKALLNTSNNLQVVGSGAAAAANALHMMKLDPKMGSSIDKARLKVSQMGVGLETAKGKILVFKNASVMAFENFKNKVTSTASTIKGKFSNALNTVKQKLDNAAAGATSFRKKLAGLKGTLENFAGQLLYDFAMGIVQMAKESINAASQLEYFGQRLYKLDGDVHLSKQGFEDFKTSLVGLQQEFRKIDMTAVGATAEELAVKMKLPSKELGNLTRMTAVLSSTLVKEGHTQEDAVLAVSDALDGQFTRLKEIGIGQQELIDNGWSGDLDDKVGLIQALNETLDDMGFTETAKDITTVDEAFAALQIAGGQLLQKVIVPLTPYIIQVVDALLKMTDALGSVIDSVSNMPDWAKVAVAVGGLGLAIAAVSTAIKLELIPSLGALLAPLAAAASSAWAFAAAMLANPLTWVAIALAVVAVAVYEVGKSFGWWTDVSSMLQAIWAGIQRLWSAFINHPDVQGVIAGIKQAWAALQPYIKMVVDWVMSFFKVSNKGNFDIVRVLIDAVSKTWHNMTEPIRLVIKIVKQLKKDINEWSSETQRKINLVKALFGQLKQWIKSTMSNVHTLISDPFGKGYRMIKTTVSSIITTVKTITGIDISAVTRKITDPFVNAYNNVCREVDKIKTKVKQIPSNIPIIGGLFGGARGGYDLTDDVTSIANDIGSLDVNMNQNLNITLDLENVPNDIDQEMLHSVVVETLTNRDVINQLVSSNDFQSIDNRVKARILARNNRARGV